MKGPNRTVAVVRAPSGEIVYKVLRESSSESKYNIWYKTPILRGLFVLSDAISLGYQALMFSGEVADPEVKNRNPYVDYLMLAFTFVIALAIFKFLPILIVRWILGAPPEETSSGKVLLGYSLAWSAVEAVLKLGIVVGYVYFIRFMKEVRRVFQYHGAEHKTINAYEAGSEMNLDDVMNYPTFHPRCGTSFLFAIILLSLLFAIFFPLITWWVFKNPLLAMNTGYRLILHLIFLPIIAMVAYEFIRFTAQLNQSSPLMKLLTLPGRFIQKITALEPERSMVEVAVEALKLVMDEEPPLLKEASDPNLSSA